MLDPATICARTAAGESELARATQGLSLIQRKVLTLLASPQVFAEFAATNNFDPDRLERDLARLRDAGLVRLDAPSAAPDDRNPAAPMTVVLGGTHSGGMPARLGLLALVAVVVAAGAWFGLRSDPAAKSVASPTVPPAGAVPAAAGANAVADATPATAAEPTTPVMTKVLRGASAPTVADPRSAPPPGALSSPAPAPPSAERPRAGPPTPTAPENSAVAATPPAAAPVPPAAGGAVAALQGNVAAAGTPAPAPATPAPAPVVVAAAVPPAAAVRPRATLTPISREQPEFPREAIAAGISAGSVTARLAIDAAGKVTGVEIVDSQPRRVFDRAVVRALSRWQFEPDAAARTTEVEVGFNRN